MSGKRLISATNVAIYIVRVGNFLFFIVFLAMLLLSAIYHTELAAKISARHPSMNSDVAIVGLRLMVLLALVWGAVNEWFLRTLLGVTRSASIGNPFIDANVPRLRTIGLSLIAMQILGLVLGLLEKHFEIGGRDFWQPSISGWLAVLLTFLLAEVFAIGSAMREEQEGTV